MKKHKPIKILHQVAIKNGWEFVVAIDSHTYEVKLRADYYQKLTSAKATPEKLILASFKYLLEREKPEQILNNFYLAEIKQYFPTYESDIKNYL